ncbi:MAG: glycosyltransferase [Nitrospirota bacterium]
MDPGQILISLIVRTKDRPILLKRAIKSIARQTYRPIEVVLVNDGGCDLDLDELKDILSDITLNYIRLGENTGRAHAANVGIEHATGDYIGFLDDDDELYPDHLHVLTRVLEKEKSMIVYTDAEMVFAELQGETIRETFRYVFYSHEFSPAALLFQNYIPFMCLLFPREVFSDARFDESFDIFEDWMFLIQLSRKHWFNHIKQVTAKYIQWSDESQITRRALSGDFSREAYMRVLERNLENISPEGIYTYCVFITTEKKKFLDELIKKESDYFNEKVELTNELMNTRSENLKLHLEHKRLIEESERAEEEIRHLREERRRILGELGRVKNQLTEMSSGLGWNLIMRYRRLKDRVMPSGTWRRGIYDLSLKSAKSLKHEGVEGFLSRAKRKSRKELKQIEYQWGLNRFRKSPACMTMELGDFSLRPVTIIMPVFNGFECLGSCIESVLANTDLVINSLVLIDDGSTDARVQEYLAKVRKWRNGRTIRILRNKNNAGFTRTVNRGMRRSSQDVLLLNSDTIVTKNWVAKLQRAAYSSPRVATATPLSNYVTINGIPEPFRFNPVPEGMTVDTLSDFLEHISLRSYPEIPAGVGFCLYIKRSVLDVVGYFDEQRFGRGYAEETDFCMKALKKGYIHVLDDATYIYHIGGVSFESVKDPEVLRKKNMMIEQNLETLRTLHPEYAGLVEKALKDSLSPLHEYIRLRLKLQESNRARIACNRSEA